MSAQMNGCGIKLNKQEKYPVSKKGKDLINDPLLNKGTALTLEERKQLRLTGLLPHKVFSIKEQLLRLRENYNHLKTDLESEVNFIAHHRASKDMLCSFPAELFWLTCKRDFFIVIPSR